MQMGEPEDAERGLTVREHFVVSCQLYLLVLRMLSNTKGSKLLGEI
jgi:hypothetical protein